VLSSDPKAVPNQVLHTVRSSASAFNFQYPRFSLRSSSSCLHLLPRLSVTSVFPSYLSFSTVFLKAVPTQDVTNPVSLPSFYCMQDIPLFLDPMLYFIFHTIGPTERLRPSPAPIPNVKWPIQVPALSAIHSARYLKKRVSRVRIPLRARLVACVFG